MGVADRMLKEKIESELTQALKAGDQLKLSVLRMLSSAIHNREIEQRTKTGQALLSEEAVVAVIRSEAKKRRDAIAEFGRGGRSDLVERESAELRILESYLPVELSGDELRSIIAEGIEAVGVSSGKEFGTLMAWVMARVRGRASGERVAELVREALAGYAG